MEILNNKPTGRPSTPDPQCSICLNELTNKCYTNVCVHLFCFDCLQWWSNTCLQRCSSSEPTCPLCKQTFRYIYHSIDDKGAFETYTVPIVTSPSTVTDVSEQVANINRMIIQSILSMGHRPQRMRPFWRPSVDEAGNSHLQLYHRQPQNLPFTNPNLPINGQRTRIQVYVDNVWAVPLPNIDDRFRHGTIAFYRNHPTQMHRLRTFVLRDLVAIRESVRFEGQPVYYPANTDLHATNLIISSLPNCEIRRLHLIENLRSFLSVHGVHFCHELYNFAQSIFEIGDYDNHVQYSHTIQDTDFNALFQDEQSIPINVVQNSNNEELQSPNIIEDSSSSDSENNSDVEIISVSFRTTDPLNSDSINQPSTSTGIRDSLDRPNNSCQSVNGGLSQVSYSSRVKRGRPNSDESDDEESRIATQGSQTANLKSRDVNNKKKKKH